MPHVVEETVTIGQSYSNLLRAKREIEKVDAAGESYCRHCSETKGNHLHDGRCSVDAMSQTFLNSKQRELDTINKAVNLIEELLALHY